uniref:JmjC domain-containing protein n=2 Tax=Haptolina ericina TaxID=156174 RepID=A0A7S3AMY9_9EUKA|mmetsp:Transcript_27003/g.61009  ORF Transcript_27003/g.61009 Transcript_27003/m.61009 type:complete len:319 (+) Transcript_27003:193-1149(+)
MDGSGQRLRQDATAWEAAVVGSKAWFLYPPETLPIEIYRYIALRQPSHWAKKDRKRLRQGGMLECVQQAGESIYIPQYWWQAWHAVGDTITIGMQEEEPRHVLSEDRYFTPRFNHARGLLEQSPNERLLKFEMAVKQDPLNVEYVHAYAFELMHRTGEHLTPNSTRLSIELIARHASIISSLWREGHAEGVDAVRLLRKHARLLGNEKLQPPHPTVWAFPKPATWSGDESGSQMHKEVPGSNAPEADVGKVSALEANSREGVDMRSVRPTANASSLAGLARRVNIATASAWERHFEFASAAHRQITAAITEIQSADPR